MIFNNTWQEYLIALAIFAGLVVLLAIVKKFLMMRAQRFVDKSRTDIDDSIFKMLNTVKPAFYWFISFYIAVQWLDFTGTPKQFIDSLLVIWVTFQVIVALQVFVDLFASKKLIDADDRSTEIVSSLVSVISKIVLWTVGLLFILSNLGVNIVSLIAGLGIGGLAVALAAQNILEDLFSSLSIYFDRPFAPGDFVEINNQSGTVQKVGMKTTHLQAVGGEQIAIPNKEIASSHVKNYKRMQARRVEFSIGVDYHTPDNLMSKIPAIVAHIIKPIEHVEFKRCHFRSFGQNGLMFEVVYIIDKRDYELYMDIHQQILLAIKTAFTQEKITIALPVPVQPQTK